MELSYRTRGICASLLDRRRMILVSLLSCVSVAGDRGAAQFPPRSLRNLVYCGTLLWVPRFQIPTLRLIWQLPEDLVLRRGEQLVLEQGQGVVPVLPLEASQFSMSVEVRDVF